MATPSRWVRIPGGANPAARLRLFCFPYAGGGASVFFPWPRALPPEVEVCAVQLPGREERLHEPPITRWDELVDQLAGALVPWMDRPFAFFGHSLGASVAFELAQRLRRDRRRGPVHLFASGRAAPHLPPSMAPVHHLPHEEFVHELRRLAGTPDEVLEKADLMEILIPLLRADFQLAETYTFQGDEPLAIPISAYGGVEDERVRPADVEGWRQHATGAFRRVMFPAGHFFVNEHRPFVLAELGRELRATLGRLGAHG
ncbi:MAG TPA: alpha/beta fold hydrolase [Longimicrobium sp.]